VTDLGKLPHHFVGSSAFYGIAKDDDEGALSRVGDLPKDTVRPDRVAHEALNGLSDHLSRSMAEYLLGGWIDGQDLAFGVERDDGVRDHAVGFRGSWR